MQIPSALVPVVCRVNVNCRSLFLVDAVTAVQSPTTEWMLAQDPLLQCKHIQYLILKLKYQ